VATVVEHGLSTIAPTVSLYVNDYNRRAISVYRKVGFEQVGEYATVLF
jgi:predicted GNAT family acetyltransferase